MCSRTRLFIGVCSVVLSLGSLVSGQQTAASSELSDRDRDGLIGPVRRITVESAKIIIKNGSATEGPRVLREVTTYDPRGKKIDSVAYPIDGETLPGKEQYKYDDKGNIVEMQLRSQDGRLLSKELYKYQMDEIGNWKKMTTSLAVFQEGSVSDEPVEVTYRSITYFYGQEVAKLVASFPASGSSARANLNEGASTQRASSQKTGIPTLEPPASGKSEPKFTNTLTAKSAISERSREDSKSSTGEKPRLFDTAPVPLSQKISSANMTAKPPDSESSSSVLEGERELSNERPSGVAISNTERRPEDSSTRPVSDANTLYRLGVSHLEAGKPSEAILTLKEAIHKDPENVGAYLKLGLSYSALRQHNEAIAVYKMAIQIRRDLVDAQAYYQLGQAYTGVGKHSDALAAFKQALYITRADTMNSNGQKARNVPSTEELRYSLGSAYHRLSKYKEAIQELRIVIELNPRLAEAHFGLAVCYISIGDRKSAEKQQKILATLNPALARKIADALSSNRIMPPGVTEGMLGSKRMN